MSADLQGSSLAGEAGSAEAELGLRAAEDCCCGMVPLSGDLLTAGWWSLCEEEAPHSHSDLKYTEFDK